MKLKILLLSMLVSVTASAQVTLKACLDSASASYPLLKRYGIIERTTDLSLSEVNKSWLPSIELYGQGTWQNALPEFPAALTDILAQMGQDFKGMGKAQYRIGVNVNQRIWDGGISKMRREAEKASADVSRAALDVDMYTLHARVENLFFGILLIQEQIAQTEETVRLLEANHRRMLAAYENGVATRADAEIIEAQTLSVKQQIIRARSAEESYRRVLSIFTGMNLDGKKLEKPAAEMASDLSSNRPELALFDARVRAAEVQRRSVDASLMPSVGFFGQAYYGYPGMDNFKSMRTRGLSFNMLVGLKVSWNIGSFYTKNNKRAIAALAINDAETDRETFLLNNRMTAASQNKEIDGIRKSMADDSRIVELRRSVRMSAESQLENGVIDATALLSKITDESQAELTARYHEIELLQKIYELKNTLNR